VLPVGRTVQPVRRSRGWAPRPVRLRRALPPVLAVGGQLKNTVCLVRGRDAFLSQHVGDLEGRETYRFFLHSLDQLERLLEVRPDRVACDLHPDYLSTRWARLESGLPVAGVQHHHAHVVSCMAEHGLSGRVLGLAMDGTGWGGDGTVWGGEFLLADERGFERAGHLPCIALPGGEAAIREPWRTARSVLSGLDAGSGLALWDRVGRKKVAAIDRMLETGINCPLSSGCGRLFDAVAAIAGVRSESLYEGQAAIELESRAWRARGGKVPVYRFELDESARPLVPDLGPLFEAVARDAGAGVDPGQIALGFHECLARVLVETAGRIAEESSINRVVLSGGVFNNRWLTLAVSRGLRRRGLRVFTHAQVPPGDGGISLGQAVIAAGMDLSQLS
jgi:hydrogenase maturation protein HypF